MSYTNGNSSKASTKEVKTNENKKVSSNKEELNNYKNERNNDLRLGFKVSGGYCTIDKNLNKININPKETINKSIPMFEVVEKSFGEYKKGTNSKGETVIVTKSTKYVKAENGKYKATPRTRKVEER